MDWAIPVTTGVAVVGTRRGWGMHRPLSWTLTALVGLAVALAGIGSRAVIGPQWPLWANVELGVLAVLTVVDATDRIIPHRIVVATALLGIGVHLWGLSVTWGLFLGAPAFLAVGLGLVWVTRDGFGLGDVKWMAGFALIVGWAWNLAAVLTGLWLAGVWVFGRRLVTHRRAPTRHVPLGPFFALGGWLALIGYAICK